LESRLHRQVKKAYIVSIRHVLMYIHIQHKSFRWTHATLWIPFGKLCLLCPRTDSTEASSTQLHPPPLDLYRHTNTKLEH